jgi:hypothetical protein
MAARLAQKRHFAADALPPHAVDKPPQSGGPAAEDPDRTTLAEMNLPVPCPP